MEKFAGLVDRGVGNPNAALRRILFRVEKTVMRKTAAFLFLFAAFAAIADDPEPVGRMVDIGGRRMHLYCTGSGAQTIVLEASGGTGFYMWHAIQAALAKDFRVCSYDRAGTAFSDARPNYAKSLVGTLDDLHETLRRAGEKPPFVMAGHSLGGSQVWKYAERYPNEVRGLVLLDAGVPGSAKARPPEVVQANDKNRSDAMARAQKQIEEWRKTGTWEEMYVPATLPPDWKEKIRQLSKTEKWWATRFSPLGPDYDEPFKTLSVPITVVTATQRMKAPGVSDELQAKSDAMYFAFLDEFFAPMKNVKHIKIDARHDFHEDEPQLVIEVIRDVAKRARE